MRVVLDTNVLVRAVLSARSSSWRALVLAFKGRLKTIYNAAIMAEYHAVLTRPELGLDPGRVRKVLQRVKKTGRAVTRGRGPPLPSIALPDEDDRPFMQLALNGKAQLILTYNQRDFPRTVCPVPAITPGELLGLLEHLRLRRPRRPRPRRTRRAPG